MRASTGKITKTVQPTKPGPVLSMTIAPGGKRLWMTGMACIAVLDATTGKTIKFMTAPKIATGNPLPNYLAVSGSGRYALGIAVDTKRRTAYVPNYDDDALTYLTVPPVTGLDTTPVFDGRRVSRREAKLEWGRGR
ncbi:YncE family protein [Microlunatus ginsengisoli]|uniref:Uncharacterized protein n=1 Tax=Microlunatus ginsengisoli TaxID=363863 RepID=A0ABP7ASR3_9ACTN